jgi:hypothetical protein
MVSEHTSKLIKEQKVGAILIGVDVLVNIVAVCYGDYMFYQYNVRRQKGSVIALPFFSYDKKQVQKFEGYLIYHDKESYGYSEAELEKLGLETIVNYSPSGMAGKLTPLPYKPISEDNIKDALDSLIEKNTKVNLTDNLSL